RRRSESLPADGPGFGGGSRRSESLPADGPGFGGGSPTPARQPRWKLTWGAFASDDAAAVVGTSSGEYGSRSARSAAMKKCSGMGGNNCAVTLVYQNQCAVIADPIDRDIQPRFGSDVSGPTIEEASKLALDSCYKKNGGRRCEVIYSNCTRPVLVN
ncbi:DUF4189 domain-containing protein, partial [Pseudoxanthomonas mexicana]|uniref:DUF4189 domain-containing protein n=1 Tax=Pseudoxanthomonas mexicana TaxID=128785 RepID=UPI0012EE21C1